VSRDLGFTAPERSENVRRVAEVARLVNNQGIVADELREPGGLYSAQAAGAAIDLPGVTSPYEAPTDPDLAVSDHPAGADAAADAVLTLLRARGYLRS
jgi:adenylylsulfate kinase-like enzyme